MIYCLQGNMENNTRLILLILGWIPQGPSGTLEERVGRREEEQGRLSETAVRQNGFLWPGEGGPWVLSLSPHSLEVCSKCRKWEGVSRRPEVSWISSAVWQLPHVPSVKEMVLAKIKPLHVSLCFCGYIQASITLNQIQTRSTITSDTHPAQVAAYPNLSTQTEEMRLYWQPVSTRAFTSFPAHYGKERFSLVGSREAKSKKQQRKGMVESNLPAGLSVSRCCPIVLHC